MRERLICLHVKYVEIGNGDNSLRKMSGRGPKMKFFLLNSFSLKWPFHKMKMEESFLSRNFVFQTLSAKKERKETAREREKRDTVKQSACQFFSNCHNF